MAAGVSILFFMMCFQSIAALSSANQYKFSDGYIPPDEIQVRMATHWRFRREAASATSAEVSITTTSPAFNTPRRSTTPSESPSAARSPPDSVTSQNEPISSQGTTQSGPAATQAFNEKESRQKYYAEKWLDTFQWNELLDATLHESLSESYRTAGTVHLPFSFHFYGHPLTSVTIATGGFLYTSNFLHQWLTATQYIAPLMANFDTRIGNKSHIYYLGNETHFIVEWQQVHLKGQEAVGNFSFQVVLFKEGNIMFNYKEIPIKAAQVHNDSHPVKVGLSDAYYIDREVSSTTKRRTIYEYHRVILDQNRLRSNVSVLLVALPTCIRIADCAQCTQVNSLQAGNWSTLKDCQWCSETNTCSDGLDRKRQQWIEKGCHQQGVIRCSGSFDIGAGIVIVLVLILVGLIVAWFVYAYMYPQSPSGIWLIEHRPTVLKNRLSKLKFWKRGDAGDKYQVSMQPGETTA